MLLSKPAARERPVNRALLAVAVESQVVTDTCSVCSSVVLKTVRAAASVAAVVSAAAAVQQQAAVCKCVSCSSTSKYVA
jgi:hypothetical protein